MTTTPDKPPETESEPILMRCSNEKCDSIYAKEIPYRKGTKMYRCTKCSHTSVIAVGGAFSMGYL